ncbi:MAG TPA: FAD-dependent oxidoreductase [Casimicrobiaceae bacterium]|nr:FAD-dependent oxidoreductase [Casimicrobiaceae bacterium]
MSDGVTRRDFLNGMALAVVAGLAPSEILALAAAKRYPPAEQGFRGSQPGSFDVAHAIRDGKRYDLDRVAIGETVDLVVVGAGLSGLATAWYWRQRRPKARILVLDAHSDFGGHAQRNEFVVDGRMLLGYGGSESLQSPSTLWSPEAKALIASLGVDLARFDAAFDRSLYPSLGLSRGVFFTREAFGIDKLVTGDPMRMVADDIPPDRMNARPIPDFVADFPLTDEMRAKLVDVYTSARDPLTGKSLDEKESILGSTSYRDWLIRHWGLDERTADVFYGRTLDFFAAGTDAVSAREALDTGYPGFAGVGVERDEDAIKEMEEPYIHHFPDGNASLARLLVRKLVPGVAPGATMDDIVTARFDYALLDRAGSPTRIRLDSTAAVVRNRDGSVDVGYVRDGKLARVRAAHCVMAGYHMMIPYVMRELPKRQRDAMSQNVKAPLVYVKVAVRNWKPWVARRVHEIANPMGFYSRVKLDYPVSLGDYRFARTPDEPMVLHLVHVPTLRGPGIDLRTRLRAGRAQLFATPFDTFERNARDELTRMLGAGGFDADRDIAAITVSRWGHGYSYSGSSLFDKDGDDERIPALARRRAGRVAFANSDANWEPYAHGAFDQARRAVNDLLGTATPKRV